VLQEPHLDLALLPSEVDDEIAIDILSGGDREREGGRGEEGGDQRGEEAGGGTCESSLSA
jgi:hypothetical protein